MTQTVYGLCASPDGHAATQVLEQGPTKPELRMKAWATPAAQIAKRQAPKIFVDVGHSHDWVGEVTYLERRAAGLWCVAEVDDSVRPVVSVGVAGRTVELEAPMYWSVERSGPAFPDIQILSVALTPRTARVAARPVVFVRGSAAEAAYRSSDSFERQLLTRASEARLKRHGAPIIIDDPLPKIGDYQLALAARTSAPMQYRSAELAGVSSPGRTIDLVIAPAESPTVIYERSSSYLEVFSHGCFAGAEEHPERVRVNRDHSLERTVGVAVELDPWADAGLVGKVKLARTPLADESLALAADGCLSASAGFQIISDTWQGQTVRRIKKANIRHIALTPDPAYETADVLAVRNGELR